MNAQRRKRSNAGFSAHRLAGVAGCLLLLVTAGCDTLKGGSQTTGSSSPTPYGAGSPGGGSATPVPTAAPQSATLGLVAPPGSQSQVTRYFTFSTGAQGDSGDFRFILPPGTAALQLSTVGSASNAVIFDLGRSTFDTGVTVPNGGGETTVQLQDGHVYAVSLGTSPVYGKVQVTAQGSGTVTFNYRFPIQR